MNELEKQVNHYYIKRFSEKNVECKQYEREVTVYRELYKEKCAEVERLELIIELLFKRLENRT